MTVRNRETGWLTPDFHERFRAILRGNALRYAIVTPAYCLMPDHFHVISTGLADSSDHQLWSRSTRRKCNEALAPKRLQKQAHDRVLRPAESGRDAFATLVHYICQNPVRAGLVGDAVEWPFTGSMVPKLPDLDPRQSDFAEVWWRYWNTLPGGVANERPAATLSLRSNAATRLTQPRTSVAALRTIRQHLTASAVDT